MQFQQSESDGSTVSPTLQRALIRMMMLLTTSLVGMTITFETAIADWMQPAASSAETDEEDDELARRPGLVAEYFVGNSKQPAVRRIDPRAGLLLAEGESPDTRLPATGFRVRWTGVIEVRSLAKYQFSASGSGGVRITVADKPVLDAAALRPAKKSNGNSASSERQQAAVAENAGTPIELDFGLHPITVEYNPGGGPAVLSVYWESPEFARELIPTRVLGHRKTEVVSDSHVTGRSMVEEHACAACHAPAENLSFAINRLAIRRGPSLADVQNRVKRQWLTDWLGDPQAFRPEAVMPRLFTADRTGDIERLAIAEYLYEVAERKSAGAALAEPGASPPGAASESSQPEGSLFTDAELGRVQYVRLGCAACHESTAGHPSRGELNQLSRKFQPKALAKYLTAPSAIDPSGRMPDFALQEITVGQLAEYLATKSSNPLFGSTAGTKTGANSTDAVAESNNENSAASTSATAPTEISLPTHGELEKLMLSADSTAKDRADFATVPVATHLTTLGRRLLVERRCSNCHDIDAPTPMNASGTEGAETASATKWRTMPAKSSLVQIMSNLAASPDVAQGCLSDGVAAAAKPDASGVKPSKDGNSAPAQQKRRPGSADGTASTGGNAAAVVPGAVAASGRAPAFGKSLDRQAVARFLVAVTKSPKNARSAPAEEFRVSLLRYNCLACHQRNGDGGLSAEVLAFLTANQTAADSEGSLPPSLSGVTEKLLESAVRGVLEEGKRARPWMSVQMPQFPKDAVHAVPAALAADEAAAWPTEMYRPASNPELVAAGRTLIGERGFSCVKCHDLLGHSNVGTRGPELTAIADRLSYAWYERWLTDPQRIHPGTRMPTVFVEGRSPYPDVLDGSPERQKLALWHYLLEAANLPLPDGMQRRTPGTYVVGKEPLLIRAFLPDVTPRSLAIAFPELINVVFDAQTCRVAYAWSGEFINTTPMWEGRGGNRVDILGKRFWSAPDGFPWEISDSTGAFPDFSNRGGNPEYGAELPHDGKLYPSRVRFKGYKLTPTGPVVNYSYAFGESERADFTEQIKVLSSEAGQGTLRQIDVKGPPRHYVWLNVATSRSAPQFRSRDDQAGVLDGPQATAAAAAIVVCETDAGSVLCHVRKAPVDAQWQVQKDGDKWRLVLRVPLSSGGETGTWSLATWTPLDAASVSKLVAEELQQ